MRGWREGKDVGGKERGKEVNGWRGRRAFGGDVRRMEGRSEREETKCAKRWVGEEVQQIFSEALVDGDGEKRKGEKGRWCRECARREEE